MKGLAVKEAEIKKVKIHAGNLRKEVNMKQAEKEALENRVSEVEAEKKQEVRMV